MQSRAKQSKQPATTDTIGASGGAGVESMDERTKAAPEPGADLATVKTRTLLDLANDGDPEAMIVLADRFKHDPKKLIRLCNGDLPKVITHLIINSMVHEKQLSMRHGILLRTEEIRADLEGPNPTPLERLITDQCVLTWVDLHTLEMQFRADGYNRKTFKQVEAMGKRLELAERRHLRALKSLADVRKLNLTAVNTF
jgi:hypothetical protein